MIRGERRGVQGPKSNVQRRTIDGLDLRKTRPWTLDLGLWTLPLYSIPAHASSNARFAQTPPISAVTRGFSGSGLVFWLGKHFGLQTFNFSYPGIISIDS